MLMKKIFHLLLLNEIKGSLPFVLQILLGYDISGNTVLSSVSLTHQHRLFQRGFFSTMAYTQWNIRYSFFSGCCAQFLHWYPRSGRRAPGE